MAWGTRIFAPWGTIPKLVYFHLGIHRKDGDIPNKSPLCGTLKCTNHLLRQDFLGVVLSLADEPCNRKARGARGARGPVGLGKGSSQAMTGIDSRNLLSCEM